MRRERVEGVEHPFDLVDRRPDGRLRFLWRGTAARRLQAAQHPRQRLAQVVGNVRADLLVRQKQLFDAVEQAVECSSERREVIVDAGERDAPAPVSSHDALRCQAHRVDAPEELRAEPKAAGDAKPQGDGDRPTEGRKDAPQEFVGATLFVSDD